MSSAVRRGDVNVFSVPPGEPFLEVLAERLIAGGIVRGFPDPADPLSLARATILLPTRRAVRALTQVFLDRSGSATLLPRIRPIGDVDEDAFAFDPEAAPESGLLPPVVSGLERQVALTRLVLAWAQTMARGGARVLVPASPADAAFLAGELARLIDMVATEGVSWESLRAILPDALQAHWQVTLDFLAIATTAWPAHLADRGLIEPAERRRLAMEAEIVRLARAPEAPVIAAGSTASIPTTAALLRTVARLPRGAVVLPGLDRDLDAATWDLLAAPGDAPDPAPSHPQTAMRAFLRHLDDLARAEVVVLTSGGPPDRVLRAREALLAEAMRPAETTDAWNLAAPRRAELAAGLDGIGLVEAETEQEEALAIAAILREAIEVPGRTAALVTPDRVLARRVAAEIGRFGLSADDTSGVPLSETAAGRLAREVADVVASGLDPVGLLALTKHPFASFGLAEADTRRAARALERLLLRGPRPEAGTAGLAAAMARAGTTGTRAAEGLSTEDRALAGMLCERIVTALTPFEALFTRPQADLLALVEAHADAVAAVRGDRAGDRDDLTTLERFFADLAVAAPEGPVVAPSAYPDLGAALMAGYAVRPRRPADERIRIYGLLEARLVRHDRIVLGGLVEGVWPAATRTDPWLSRTMRAEMLLPAPERRIGLSAHDFAQALGTRDVVLTRAVRRGGAPTVPSRWLQRIAAVVGESALEPCRNRGRAYLAAVRALDDPRRAPAAVARPEPAPPVALRPRKLSVTEIETWLRDPYSIYARHVLRLRPFEAIAEAPDAADRGMLLHHAAAAYAAHLNEGGLDGVEHVLRIARAAFDEAALPPEVEAYWWPRLADAARFLVEFERRRRADGRRIAVEVSGTRTFDTPGGPFTLTARADRIEQRPDGTFAVVDFKTGAPPTQAQVRSGLSPQLPLEAAMLTEGGFATFSERLVPAELLYVALQGGREGGAEEARTPKQGSVEDFVGDAWKRLRHLVAAFDQPDQGYRALPATKQRLAFGDYDHLARVREWGIAGEEDEGA